MRRPMARWSVQDRAPAFIRAPGRNCSIISGPGWWPNWTRWRMVEIPSFADVVAAAARIKPYAVRTPLVESTVLGDLTGARVFLKCEIFQRTGSFKFRGAFNRIALIPARERTGGVVAFSSGNHAQGVAAAAKLFAMPAVIVMPADAPRPKIEGTRALGAQ